MNAILIVTTVINKFYNEIVYRWLIPFNHCLIQFYKRKLLVVKKNFSMHFSSSLITLKVQKVISQPKYFMHECSLYGTNLEADVMLLTKAQFQFNNSD